MTKNNGTNITSFDVIRIYDELKVVETKDERNEILNKYGYQGSDAGFEAFKGTVRIMEMKIEKYGELPARIYATGRPMYLCSMAVNSAIRSNITTTEQLRQVLKLGYKDAKKGMILRNCGSKVWKVWEDAIKLVEKA